MLIACAATALALLRRSTALHWASWEGHTETANALAAAGADVHCNTNDGYGSAAEHHSAVGECVICRRLGGGGAGGGTRRR